MKENGWHYIVYAVHVGLKTLDQHRTNRWQLRRPILLCFRLLFSFKDNFDSMQQTILSSKKLIRSLA